MLHDFQQSLAKSHRQVNAPWWEPVYRSAFPNFACMHSVRDDGWAQRGGIDRVIVLTSGKSISVDEKVRDEDWPDLLWEYLSDKDRRTPGWCAKDLACDYIAYAFVPSQRCFLLPTLQVRRAWLDNGAMWLDRAENEKHGYRIVAAKNNGYVTLSVAVPLRETMRAVRDAMIVRW